MNAHERRAEIAATLPQGDCDCNGCLDRLISETALTDATTEPATMTLTIELTATEYHGLMQSLKHATYAIRPQVNDTDQLELLHLMTLLAEAAAPDRKATA